MHFISLQTGRSAFTRGWSKIYEPVWSPIWFWYGIWQHGMILLSWMKYYLLLMWNHSLSSLTHFISLPSNVPSTSTVLHLCDIGWEGMWLIVCVKLFPFFSKAFHLLTKYSKFLNELLNIDERPFKNLKYYVSVFWL